MKSLINKLFFVVFLILFISISSDVIIEIPPFSNRSVQANVSSQLFNFTINNTEENSIIQVNITLPNGFNYVSDSANTNALFESFEVYENTLSWYNSSGLILAFENRSFWFNSSVSDIGIYNFTISLLYSNGSIEIREESVYVRKVFVEVDLDKYLINIGENITIFGKLYDENKNPIEGAEIYFWIDEIFIGNSITSFNGDFSYVFNSSILNLLNNRYEIKVNGTYNYFYFENFTYFNTSTNITIPGYYILGNDIINSLSLVGINISAPNVILDCNGKRIDGNFSVNDISSKNLYGIFVDNFNVTIRNCIISRWQTGIFLSSRANNCIIENNTINNIFGSSNGGNAIGIMILSNGNIITNNSIFNLTGGTGGTGGYQGSGGSGGISTGVYLLNSFNNTFFSNSIFNLTGGTGGTGGYEGSGGSGGISTGIYLLNSFNNTFYSNSIFNLTGGTGGTRGTGGFYGSGGSGGISTGIWIGDSISLNNEITPTIDNNVDISKLNYFN
ncbi:MAG: hypothetical protein QW678_02260, partial [Candidatus Aenigmatarchaeota archaeon]